MTKITEKKKAIFESTLQLIMEHGFHGTPMSLVAKNADVAAGTIYHYFDSKDDLICQLYQYSKSRVSEVIDESIEYHDASFRERFFQLFKTLFEFYNRNTQVLIFFEQFVNSPYNSSKSHINKEGPLYKFITEGLEQGILKQVKIELLIVLILGNIATIAKFHKYRCSFTEADLHQAIEITWDGIVQK